MHKVDEVIERLRAANPSRDGATTLEDEAADLLASMKEALEEIRDQEEHEIALDPDWPRRIARNALNGEKND